MTWISQPFIKYRCEGCGNKIERQIRAKKAEQEISDLRDGPPLYCAQCEALRVAYHGDVKGDAAPA
jgi:hypothetical protein